MKVASPVLIIGGIGDNRRGVDDELDVVDDDGREQDVQRPAQASTLPADPRYLPKRRHRLLRGKTLLGLSTTIATRLVACYLPLAVFAALKVHCCPPAFRSAHLALPRDYI